MTNLTYKMLYFVDNEYGVLYLAPLCNRWYVGFEEEYPHYYLLDESRKKILEVSQELPEVVANKLLD